MCFRVLTTIFLIYYFNSGLCEELIDLSCTTDDDCDAFLETSQNATCMNNQCICYDMNIKRIQCRPIIIKSNMPNLVGGQCPCEIANTMCDEKDNVCKCREGFIHSDDRLRCLNRAVPLGEFCKNDDQCIHAEPFSECNPQDGLCRCQQNYTSHEDFCLPIIGLDEACEQDSQCQSRTNNSKCLKYRCACIEGYIAETNRSQCLISSGFGESCYEKAQCKQQLGTGSICDMGVCMCDSNHYYVKGHDKNASSYCKRKIVVGESCMSHHECYHRNSNGLECYLGSCVCRKGYMKKDKLCIPSSRGNVIILGKSFCLLSFIVQRMFIMS